MSQTLVTAGATLLALVVGVLVEPIKTGFGTRAKRKEVLAQQCGAFMQQVSEAALLSRELNRLISYGANAKPQVTSAAEKAAESVGKKLDRCEAESNATLRMLTLYAPDDLQKLADAMHRKVRPLGVVGRFMVTGVTNADGTAEILAKFHDSASSLESDLEEFARQARRWTM